MMKKKIQIGSLFLLVALIAFIGWYRWDSSLDRGYEFGYWGSFNRVSNSLARLPGITVVNSGHNADVTMENSDSTSEPPMGRTFMSGSWKTIRYGDFQEANYRRPS